MGKNWEGVKQESVKFGGEKERERVGARKNKSYFGYRMLG